jgi:S-formylglutathione hydrolase FrmB
MSWEVLSEHACFGGVQGFYRHASHHRPADAAGCVQAAAGLAPTAAVPALIYLAGLTCTEETFAIKAGAQRVAAELGLMLVTPDTSPRGTNVAGADDAGTLARPLASTWTPRSRPGPALAHGKLHHAGAAGLLAERLPCRPAPWA